MNNSVLAARYVSATGAQSLWEQPANNWPDLRLSQWDGTRTQHCLGDHEPDTRPRVKPNTTVLRKIHRKMTSNVIQLHSYSNVLLIGEASSCRRWEEMQRPTARHLVHRERGTLEPSALNGMLLSDPSPRGSWNPAEEDRWKSVWARVGGGHQGGPGPLNQLEQSKHELRDRQHASGLHRSTATVGVPQLKGKGDTCPFP